jgi:hypothetical protein
VSKSHEINEEALGQLLTEANKPPLKVDIGDGIYLEIDIPDGWFAIADEDWFRYDRGGAVIVPLDALDKLIGALQQLKESIVDEQKETPKEETYKPEVGDVVIYKVQEKDDPEINYNYATELPAVVVRVWGDTCVNLKVLTDGPADAWKTSVLRGDDEGEWQPKKVQEIGVNLNTPTKEQLQELVDVVLLKMLSSGELMDSLKP